MMQKLRDLPRSITVVRDAITASIESLVESRISKEPYPDVDQLCAYQQWTVDYAEYLRLSNDYFEKVKMEIEAEVAKARKEFHVVHARLREEILWGWCPIWLILKSHEQVVQELPPMPWTHSSTFLITLW